MKLPLSKQKESSTQLRAVDFFCGAGGMSFGLAKAGITMLAGLDMDSSCGRTYETNVKGARFLAHDVSELGVSTLAKELSLSYNDDSLLLTGCSPCQFWSKVNTDKTKSRQSAFLLKEFSRFVVELNPGWVVIENVPGLVSKAGSALPAFLRLLKKRGYSFTHGVLDLSLYRIPQTRHRFVLVANRLGLVPSLPAPASSHPATVRETLGIANGFPAIPAGHVDSTARIHTSSSLSPTNLARMMKTPKDGGSRRSWQNEGGLEVAAYTRRADQFTDVYSRMAWDRPAPTITTRFNSFSNGRFGHPEEHRAISLREGASLQTFPKSYRFFGNQLAIARQIGNAVPPAFARLLGRHILQQLSSLRSDA
jgi:DNA (cytosine-5)-methyltransferase 1